MPDDSTHSTTDHEPHRAAVWTADVPGAVGTRIVRVPVPALGALAEGDLAAGQRLLGDDPRLTPFVVGPRSRSVWDRRSRQVAQHPADAAWVTRLLVAPSGEVVGRAGFHGAPQDGTVEVGYEVAPEAQRRGHARAALRILLDVARREQGVRTVRATIRPDNVASRSLAEAHGLVVTGEQWDEEDGLETIFEIAV
ncbi:acetyltransferase, ribosomal protein N-acetylase [Sanguibacter keddieii DSM 10542]|uniref:Acetyltransferase, ribosomal protein N-acetylase n=1 Tax=Sanguibacter keddieii (strain ATCC 51767 / DSM 10542 / NCFB 3025 / ST-74) TaxID=446469 RepID=D1BH19_SANKS|nr:GNAT family protein [Sanguibacter keddieii]ACZ21739.1 acetyltransferase, ribosomal protein N-acetylase [Sanguibacter keddieii DSM 10542]